MGSFTTLINPEKEIPDFISSITGITNEMLKDAPRFLKWLNKLWNLRMEEFSSIIALPLLPVMSLSANSHRKFIALNHVGFG